MLILELCISSPGWRLMILIVQLHSDISTCMSSPWWQFKHSMCQTELLSMPLWSGTAIHPVAQLCGLMLPLGPPSPSLSLILQITFSFLASVSLLGPPPRPAHFLPCHLQASLLPALYFWNLNMILACPCLKCSSGSPLSSRKSPNLTVGSVIWHLLTLWLHLLSSPELYPFTKYLKLPVVSQPWCAIARQCAWACSAFHPVVLSLRDVPCRGNLAIPEDIFGCHKRSGQERELLLASGDQGHC